jgi:uncharacterized protein
VSAWGWDIWLPGLLGALAVGLGKGGVPGIGNLTVVLYAMAFGGKPSVGLLLPILMCADLFAVWMYRKNVSWKHLGRLLPWMLPGIVLGYYLVDRINSRQVEILIGAVVLGMSAVHLGRAYWRSRHPDRPDTLPDSLAFRSSLGLLGGFSTMVANAAGPVGDLYFAAMRLPKLLFVGTKAWCFFFVNWIKIPFFLDLGLLDGASLTKSAAFMPAAVAGALLAPAIVRRIPKSLFDRLIWTFIFFAGLKMLF